MRAFREVSRCVCPRMGVLEHHRLPGAAMPYARRHLADVDTLELEAFEHERSDSRDGRVRGEAGRSLRDARSTTPCGPKGTSTTDWHGHRAGCGISVGVMPLACGARRPRSRGDADRRIAIG